MIIPALTNHFAYIYNSNYSTLAKLPNGTYFKSGIAKGY